MACVSLFQPDSQDSSTEAANQFLIGKGMAYARRTLPLFIKLLLWLRARQLSSIFAELHII
jgi:hypothetical protein